MTGSAGEPLLAVRGVSKQFGAVTALHDVSFDVLPGEVVALLGDNGAGKSTLIRGLSGVHGFDSGEVWFDGSARNFESPVDARASGIETAYQTLAVFDNLDPAANFYIGRELSSPKWLGSLGVIRKKDMLGATRERLDDLEVHVPSLTQPLGVMSGGQRQAIACARAVAFASKLVILDEPTAALGLRESSNVLRLVKRLPELGISVILISHNLEEVMAVANRAVVLRQGRCVGQLNVSAESHADLVSLIVSGRLASGDTWNPSGKEN
jgi:ABC-type sugar transport system ATPase subunit